VEGNVTIDRKKNHKCCTVEEGLWIWLEEGAWISDPTGGDLEKKKKEKEREAKPKKEGRGDSGHGGWECERGEWDEPNARENT